MESVEVIAHFDLHGKIIPKSLTWQGQNYQIESVGRQWSDEQGRHILVMISGGLVMELLFVLKEHRWYLGRKGSQQVSV
jgi:hypothetical protein